MNAVKIIDPESTNNFATSVIRRIFSVLSSGENPKSLFNPIRTLSPSKIYVRIPLSCKIFSVAFANVDFPDANSTHITGLKRTTDSSVSSVTPDGSNIYTFNLTDADNKYKEGDNVEIIECRPKSKNKKWEILLK